jgi:predicted transposase/invertase (TIGR01784 family)
MPRKLVTFDWALKRLLRSKANFKVLEGFLSELLHEDIRIVELLESEGNKEGELDKYNRVDLLVKDQRGRRIIIELQYTRQSDYLQRMVYGTAKILAESMNEGQGYRDIARVVSVNILHFDLGQGEDYIYEGFTEFRGVHRHDRLDLTPEQREIFRAETVRDIFPEYYILKVNNFNDVAKDTLDQWIYFLKNGSIQPKFRAKGLREAQKAMDVMNLSRAEKVAYDQFIKRQRIDMSIAEDTVLRAERAELDLANERQAKAEVERAKAEVEQHLESERQAKIEAEQAKLEAERRLENERRSKEEALRIKDVALANALKAMMQRGLSKKQAKALFKGD